MSPSFLRRAASGFGFCGCGRPQTGSQPELAAVASAAQLGVPGVGAAGGRSAVVEVSPTEDAAGEAAAVAAAGGGVRGKAAAALRAQSVRTRWPRQLWQEVWRREGAGAGASELGRAPVPPGA